MPRIFWITASALALATGLPGPTAAATPPPMQVPASDDVVLERYTLRSWSRPRADAPSPRLADRLAQARSAIEQGLRTGDPRQFGQAEALLLPFDALAMPPAELRLLRSSLARWRHDFDAARTDLDAVIANTPSHPQARLHRAGLNLVQGRIAEALTDCEHLAALGPTLVAQACVAAAEAGAGRVESAYRRLRMRLATDPGAASNETIWALGLSADLAERLGRDLEAEQLYREALSLGETPDLPTQLALADLLLRVGRGQDAVDLLSQSPGTDAVLLRRAAATRGSTRQRLLDEVDTGLQAGLQRGGSLHLREATQLAMLRGEFDQALRHATDNWREQREPLDALLLAQSAQASGQVGLPESLRRWMQDSGYVDRRLDLRQEPRP